MESLCLSPGKMTCLTCLPPLRDSLVNLQWNHTGSIFWIFFPCQLAVADQVAILDYSLAFEFPFHAWCFVPCRFYRTVRTYLPTSPISSLRTLQARSFSCSAFRSLLSHPHGPQLQLKSPCEIGNSAPWWIISKRNNHSSLNWWRFKLQKSVSLLKSFPKIINGLLFNQISV